MSIPGLLRGLSLLLTAVVVISFVSFVWDEAGTASTNQLLISRPGGEPAAYTRDEHGRMNGLKHSQMREKIDEVNDTITSPGEGLGQSVGGTNEWAMRGVAFLFGFLVFFVGLRVLANWIEMSGRPEETVGPTGGDDFTAGYR